MKKLSFILVVMLAVTALAERASAPLIMLREARQGYENVIWMEQRVKIGGESVNGYYQGTGGADDALAGFTFKHEWDMLTATVGFLDTAPEGRKAEFFLEADGKVLFSSGILESKGPSHQVRVPIRGYKNILLRISSDRYNGTAGAAWGAPTVFSGLSAEEMKNDWSLSVNNHKVPLPGNNAPPEVPVNFDVPPTGEEVEYRVIIKRDPGTRTVVVEKERSDS